MSINLSGFFYLFSLIGNLFFATKPNGLSYQINYNISS